jgi:hypothetical protein
VWPRPVLEVRLERRVVPAWPLELSVETALPVVTAIRKPPSKRVTPAVRTSRASELRRPRTKVRTPATRRFRLCAAASRSRSTRLRLRPGVRLEATEAALRGPVLLPLDRPRPKGPIGPPLLHLGAVRPLLPAEGRLGAAQDLLCAFRCEVAHVEVRLQVLQEAVHIRAQPLQGGGVHVILLALEPTIARGPELEGTGCPAPELLEGSEVTLRAQELRGRDLLRRETSEDFGIAVSDPCTDRLLGLAHDLHIVGPLQLERDPESVAGDVAHAPPVPPHLPAQVDVGDGVLVIRPLQVLFPCHEDLLAVGVLGAPGGGSPRGAETRWILFVRPSRPGVPG